MAALLQAVFLAALVVWTATSAAVILGRLAYDLRQRRLDTATRQLASLRSLPEQRRAGVAARLLGRFPRRFSDRVAADSRVPVFVAEAFAASAVARWGSVSLRRDALARGPRARWRRVGALRILARAQHPQLVPLLRAALHCGDATVTGAAVALLGRVPERRAAELLIELLRDGSYPGSRVATALESFPLAIPDLLLPMLSAPAASTRLWAATLLARYPEHPGLGDALAALERDPDASVRRAAVESLGKVGGPAAATTALRLLQDPAWYVQAHAARALGELRRGDLAGRVTPLLAHEQWWVRLAARETLEAFGPVAWSEVAACLDHSDRFAREGAALVLQSLQLEDPAPAEPGRVAGLLPLARLEEVCR